MTIYRLAGRAGVVPVCSPPPHDRRPLRFCLPSSFLLARWHTPSIKSYLFPLGMVLLHLWSSWCSLGADLLYAHRLLQHVRACTWCWLASALPGSLDSYHGRSSERCTQLKRVSTPAAVSKGQKLPTKVASSRKLSVTLRPAYLRYTRIFWAKPVSTMLRDLSAPVLPADGSLAARPAS